MKKVLKYSSLAALGFDNRSFSSAPIQNPTTSSGKTEIKVATNASPKPFNYEEMVN